MKTRFLLIALATLLCGVPCMAGDTVQVVPWSFVLTNASGSTVTNLNVQGEVDRVEIDQTAGSSNMVTITIDSYIDQTILAYDSQVADVTLYPETLVHKSTDGTSAAFYKPIWIPRQAVYCTVTNYLAATTNALKVYLFLRGR